MNKLIDFKNDETSISKIFGGAWVKTNSSRTNESGCKERFVHEIICTLDTAIRFINIFFFYA